MLGCSHCGRCCTWHLARCAVLLQVLATSQASLLDELLRLMHRLPHESQTEEHVTCDCESAVSDSPQVVLVPPNLLLTLQATRIDYNLSCLLLLYRCSFDSEPSHSSVTACRLRGCAKKSSLSLHPKLQQMQNKSTRMPSTLPLRS